MQKARRDFLKTVGAGSALWLTGCSTIDKMVIGDIDGAGQKVLIIGAGLAGLTAAYELKKRKIPFRLLEASHRVGGRIWTVKNINISSNNGDLGGEDIEISHKEIQLLAKELSVPVNEMAPILGYSWLGQKEELSAKEWLKEAPKLENIFKKLQSEAYGSSVQYISAKNKAQFPRAAVIDQMSVAELLQGLSKEMSSWMKPFMMKVTETQWGCNPEEISALQLLYWSRESLSIHRRKYLRVDGGSENLIQALYDRVAGVIPDRYIKFQHVLKKIEKSDKNWTLGFDTNQGYREFSAPAVICTLPPSMYANINGWDHLAGAESRISGQQTRKSAAQSKILMSFKERYWRNHSILGGGGSIISNQQFGRLSHAGSMPLLQLGTAHAVLQSQLGGAAAEAVNPETVKAILTELRAMDPKADTYEDIYHLQNWKNYPWSRGGRSFAAPGQYQAWEEDMGYENADSWSFAGDSHSLRYLGSMNGAVETALMAVDKVAKVV